MKNNILRPLLSGVVCFLFSTTIIAQNERDIHLLYNTVPVFAKVSDSAEVVQIIRTEPSYMEGFQGIGVENTKPAPENAEVKVLQPSNAGTFVVSSEYYDIPFREGFAVLDDDAALMLDDIITVLKNNPSKGVIISIFNDYVFTNIYKNRVNAIKSYMKIEGITQDRIKLNYLEGTSNQNILKVHFIE
ncbi:MAG: hypothetical protein IPN79_02020 [Saprospiraceae bacterium]|nr:hypothetical protein [Saprospiraceae bacterium]